MNLSRTKQANRRIPVCSVVLAAPALLLTAACTNTDLTRGNLDIYLAGAVGALLLLFLVLRPLVYRWSKARADRVFLEEHNELIPATLELSIEQLQTNPELLIEIQGKVARIGVIQNPIPGPYGLTVEHVYQSFLVDLEGETRELETDGDRHHILVNAYWLAEKLGVPVEDTSQDT